MINILIILASTFMGAFNFGFFLLGYHLGTKSDKKEGLTVTHRNKEFVEEMAKWNQFKG